MNTPSIQELKRALAIKEKIEALEAELNSIFGGASTVRLGRPPGSGKRKGISAAGSKRIAEAQKRRWAKLKGGIEAKPAKKGRKKMSAASKAKIAAAAKARWAKAKTEGKTSL